MRYRVVQHFGPNHNPIYAALEREGTDYQPPPEIQEETRSIQRGNWIAGIAPIESSRTLDLIGAKAVAGTE